MLTLEAFQIPLDIFQVTLDTFQKYCKWDALDKFGTQIVLH